MILERLLDEFTNEMLNKFRLRKWTHKEQGESVTDDSFDWANYPIKNIEAHFIEEFFEKIAARTERDKMKEDIDVANTAFLDWAMRKARSGF